VVSTPIAGQPALRSLAQCPVEYHQLFSSHYKPSHRDFPQRELTHNYCYPRGYRCLKKSVTQKEGQNDTRQHTRIHRGGVIAIPLGIEQGKREDFG